MIECFQYFSAPTFYWYPYHLVFLSWCYRNCDLWNSSPELLRKDIENVEHQYCTQTQIHKIGICILIRSQGDIDVPHREVLLYVT
jgi:hypothetical protein